MRWSSGIKFFLVLAVIAAMTAIVFTGLKIPNTDFVIPKAYDGIRYGIDISGGSCHQHFGHKAKKVYSKAFLRLI